MGTNSGMPHPLLGVRVLSVQVEMLERQLCFLSSDTCIKWGQCKAEGPHLFSEPCARATSGHSRTGSSSC